MEVAKQWLLNRENYTHKVLLNELGVSEPNDFRNLIRMNADMLEELLTFIAPQIERWDTIMWNAIPVGQRLSITLHCYRNSLTKYIKVSTFLCTHLCRK